MSRITPSSKTGVVLRHPQGRIRRHLCRASATIGNLRKLRFLRGREIALVDRFISHVSLRR
jgi:hypothetical protein